MRGSASRRWALVWALLLVGAIGGGTFGVTPSATAAVSWMPSTGLLVSEVITGGATASDELVELYNGAPVPLDLSGLELVYVTSSGSTVTRKATWGTPTSVDPGRHVLVANAAGIHASAADATYSGGFAATGGALVLRIIGGEVIDALAWGDATSAFVEGTAGPSPPAGSSLERLPGGAEGNARDTNDNAADTHVQAAPVAQNLASAATPPTVPAPTAATVAPSAMPTVTATPEPATEPPTAAPTEPPTAAPTVALPPTAAPTVAVPPTAAPTEPPTPEPTEQPTREPTEPPTAAPTAAPTEPPSPTATTPQMPSVQPIVSARSSAEGSEVVVEGVLTTRLGLVEDGHGAFLQDTSAGIGLYLPTSDWPPTPAGTFVRVVGTVDTRYAQATLRISLPEGVTPIGPAGWQPEPIPAATGDAGESLEGMLIAVEGSVVGSPDAVADGHAIDVDDGSGPLRVIVVAASGIPIDALPKGASVRLIGVLGQRDSSGTGTTGYRLYLRSPADVTPIVGATAPPTPMPSSQPPSPSPTAPGPSASPSPSQTPAPAPAIAIAAARRLPQGVPVVVRGVVVAELGRLVDGRTFFVADATGGIAVRLEGSTPPPTLERGRSVTVAGRIGQRYGNLEVRVAGGTPVPVGGVEPLPVPIDLPLNRLGESTEGRLARISGTIAGVDANSSGSTSVRIRDGAAEARVFIFASADVDGSTLRRGARLSATGIVGQRASGAGRQDGYRLWPRDRADLVISSATAPTPRPGGTPSPRPGGPAQAPIAEALRLGGTVTVEGVVTAPPGLLDADGRRTTLQDTTGAVLVRLPSGMTAPLATRLRVTGKVGTYFGGPQLAATDAERLGQGQVSVRPHSSGPLTASLEWQIVSIEGRVVDVRRSGRDWRASVRIGTGTEILVSATERAGIASTAVPEGASVSFTGLVRRPYPTASDRRYALVPRFPADVRLRSAPPRSPGGGGDGDPSDDDASASGKNGRRAAFGGAVAVAPGQATDITLDRIAEFAGRLVRVGGEVADRGRTAIALDDGHGTAVARFPGAAEPLVALVEPGDVVNVVGHVARGATAWEIVADEATALTRVGALSAGAGTSAPKTNRAGEATTPPTAGAEDAQGRKVPTAGVLANAVPLSVSRGGAIVLAVLCALAVIGTLVAIGAFVVRRRRAAMMAARWHTLGLDAPPGGQLDDTRVPRTA